MRYDPWETCRAYGTLLNSIFLILPTFCLYEAEEEASISRKFSKSIVAYY